MKSRAKHIVVHGRVQGVGFRYYVQHHGQRLGLTGNVRNLDDGAVEILVEGNPKRIDEFIQRIEAGPPLARVVRLNINDIPAEGHYSSFQLEGW